MLYLQDVLPIAPFFTDQDLYQAEWKVECFMRDVLVPLAAETNALVIGAGQSDQTLVYDTVVCAVVRGFGTLRSCHSNNTATKDATLMMMFGRVAESLETKYGYVGTQAAIAVAPSLSHVILVPAGCESFSFLSTLPCPWRFGAVDKRKSDVIWWYAWGRQRRGRDAMDHARARKRLSADLLVRQPGVDGACASLSASCRPCWHASLLVFFGTW